VHCSGNADEALRMAKRAKTFDGPAEVRAAGERYVQAIVTEAGTGASVQDLRRKISTADNAYVRHLLENA
jgi:hypothetical protein